MESAEAIRLMGEEDTGRQLHPIQLINLCLGSPLIIKF